MISYIIHAVYSKFQSHSFINTHAQTHAHIFFSNELEISESFSACVIPFRRDK